MGTKELFAAGRLEDAIVEATAQVRAAPGDAARRLTLFDLLCFDGAWDRALKQLDVLIGLAGEDAGQVLALQSLAGLVAAERHRAAVFEGTALPEFYAEPPAYVEAFIVMARKSAASPAEAAALVEEAEQATPLLRGTRNGRPFEGFRDADDRVSGVLEIFHANHYLWLPLDRVRRIEVQPPRDARDLLWVRARIESVEEQIAEAYVPGLYVHTARATDAAIRTGQAAAFELVGERMLTGLGARLFLVGEEEIPFQQLGTVTLEASAEAGAS